MSWHGEADKSAPIQSQRTPRHLGSYSEEHVPGHYIRDLFHSGRELWQMFIFLWRIMKAINSYCFPYFSIRKKRKDNYKDYHIIWFFSVNKDIFHPVGSSVFLVSLLTNLVDKQSVQITILRQFPRNCTVMNYIVGSCACYHNNNNKIR